MEEEQRKGKKFSDYIYVLYKWKKFLFINLFIIVAIATLIAFLIPKQYKATATVMIPPENSLGLGGLAGLVSGKSSAASLGSKLLGIGNTSEDMLLGILNSRTTLTNVINNFHLIRYYDIDDNNMDKAIKAFKGDVSFGSNEYGMVDIIVINKDPKKSAQIANYLVTILDSINIKFNIEQASNNRRFIEKRYFQNLDDLKKAEDSLYRFQKRYGIVAVPEQLEVSVKAAAEIEAQLAKKEVEAYFIKQQFGENSPHYKGVISEYNLLRDKVLELKNSSKMSSTSNILFPFKEMPDISIKYLRYYRELETQQTILEVVLPLYEQAKVEEQKSIPTIMVLDEAVPPQLKDSPKKTFIILLFFFGGLFLMIPIILAGEKITYVSSSNILEEKTHKFFISIKRLYRI
ncbi:MAG: hypothetical protein ABI550_00885 [Ignavibacteriaceae bacterium]